MGQDAPLTPLDRLEHVVERLTHGSLTQAETDAILDGQRDAEVRAAQSKAELKQQLVV